MNSLNFKPFPILYTERLILRQLSMKDDILIYNNYSNIDVKDSSPYYKSIEEVKEYINKMNTGIENNQWIIWAITNKNSDELLGTISIWNIHQQNEQAELGYGLFPKNIGHGIMSEAIKKVVHYGLNILGLKIIEVYTESHNEKSISLLERNHFRKKASIMENDVYSNKLVEMAIYEYINECE